MTESTETSPWPEAGKADLAVVVAGFVAGHSLAEIAAAAGCSVSSVQRGRRHPAVRQAIHDAREDQRRQVLGQLGAARAKAMLVLADLLDDDQPKVRLAAVNLALSRAQRYEGHCCSERSRERPAANLAARRHLTSRRVSLSADCDGLMAPSDSSRGSRQEDLLCPLPRMAQCNSSSTGHLVDPESSHWFDLSLSGWERLQISRRTTLDFFGGTDGWSR